MSENEVRKIIIAFLVFFALFLANLFVPVFAGIGVTSRMWLVLDVCVTAIAVVLLIKNGLPSNRRILLSCMFGLLMFVAYRGFNFSSVKGFLTTALCASASFSVFGKYPDNAVPVVKDERFLSVPASILIGFGVGGVLGVINLFLGGQPLDFHFTLACVLTALSPAILEEVCYRLLIFAFCLYLLKGEVRSKSENFWCYFMMIIPHVMIHTPDVFLATDLISGVVNILILSLLFGLPFALLQRKRDLASAMIAHGTVDVIRFAFMGLPF